MSDAPLVQRAVYFVEVPPSTNAIWAFRPRSRTVTKSAAYRTWLQVNSLLLTSQGIVRVPTPVHLWFTLIAGIDFDIRRDVDNLVKPLVDLLRHNGIIADDNLKHVHAVSIRAHRSPKPGCLVRIRVVSRSHAERKGFPC